MTPIRFLTAPPLRSDSEWPAYNGTLDWARFQVGDMAYFHFKGAPYFPRRGDRRPGDGLPEMNLTAHYWAHNVNRPPLVLALPDAASKSPLYFTVDGQCYDAKCTKCGHTPYAKNNPCVHGPEYTPRGHYDGWTVTGSVPLITVAPSINYDCDDPPMKHYHGFVQNGVIGDG